MRVQSLGWEDPLKEGIATHSSVLGWRIPWTEEPGGQQSMGSQKSWTQLKQLSTYTCMHTCKCKIQLIKVKRCEANKKHNYKDNC